METETTIINQIYFIPIFCIMPAYGMDNSTELLTYKVVDQLGNIWHYDTYFGCERFMQLYLRSCQI